MVTCRASSDFLRSLGATGGLSAAGPSSLKDNLLLPVLDMDLAEEDRPLFDELVHPGNAVSDFHHTNEWMKARVLD